jgi:hypothetical protein
MYKCFGLFMKNIPPELIKLINYAEVDPDCTCMNFGNNTNI